MLRKAIDDAGYTEPTEIQLKAMPKILKGFDIRASAQTGTGKTGAFLIPALELLTRSQKKGRGPRILILVPTRELAMQVSTQATKYGKFLKEMKTVCVVGGVSYETQLRKLSKPYDILIATPGRLIDFLEQRKIDFPRLEMLILDEADRMLDMGFQEQVETILEAAPKNRQTLLFSATLQGSVKHLSEKYMNKPMDIIVHSDHEPHANITQLLHYVKDLANKKKLLEHLLQEEEMDRTIVFTSTKRQADILVKNLHQGGHLAAALHGDMTQGRRTRTITQLREGKIKILIATDVAARGIDIQLISHVINFDLPRNVEDYVHRIGRTGRANSKGIALSFATREDTGLVKRIQEFTGQEIDLIEIPGFEAPPLKKKPMKQTFKPRQRKFSPAPKHRRR